MPASQRHNGEQGQDDRPRSRSRSRSGTPNPPSAQANAPPPSSGAFSHTTPASLKCPGIRREIGRGVDLRWLPVAWLEAGKAPFRSIQVDLHCAVFYARDCDGTLKQTPSGWRGTRCKPCEDLHGSAPMQNWAAEQKGLKAREWEHAPNRTVHELEKSEKAKIQRLRDLQNSVKNLALRLETADNEIKDATRLRQEASKSSFPRLGTAFRLVEEDSFATAADFLASIRKGDRHVHSYTLYDYEVGSFILSLSSNALAHALNRLGFIPSPASIRRHSAPDAFLLSPRHPVEFEIFHNLSSQLTLLKSVGENNPKQLWTVGTDESEALPAIELVRGTHQILGIDREQARVLDLSASEENLAALVEKQEAGELVVATKVSAWALYPVAAPQGSTPVVFAASGTSGSTPASLERDIQLDLRVMACVRFFLEKHDLGTLVSVSRDGEGHGRTIMQHTCRLYDLRDKLPPEAADQLRCAYWFDYACGEAGLVNSHDFRHSACKRGCSSYTNEKGPSLCGVKLAPTTVVLAFQVRHNLSQAEAERLVTFTDKQSVPLSTNCHHHLYPCSDPTPPSHSLFPTNGRVTPAQYRLLAFEARVWGRMSKATFLLIWAYETEGTGFCSAQLAHDLAAYAKELAVVIVRSGPNDLVFLGQLGTDQLEAIFSLLRGRYGSDVNFSIVQFGHRTIRLSSSRDFMRKRKIEPQSSRRSFTPDRDYLTPSEITGDSHVSTLRSVTEEWNAAFLKAVAEADELAFDIVPSEARSAASVLSSPASVRSAHPDVSLLNSPRFTPSFTPPSMLAPSGTLICSGKAANLALEPHLQPLSYTELDAIYNDVSSRPCLHSLIQLHLPSSATPIAASDLSSFSGRLTGVNRSINPFRSKPSADRLGRYSRNKKVPEPALAMQRSSQAETVNELDGFVEPGSFAASVVKHDGFVTLAVVRVLDIQAGKDLLLKLPLPPPPSTQSAKIRATIVSLAPFTYPNVDITRFES
ncbi:hypothetical protein JCM11251_004222 [Rhodosporidiobolus azoricus]